ncbi:hypothetical protein [Ornithinimicrobium cryptoxanthini]|uniref:hypothetical protein n=1 Tax=Ornithinimicrobium cryptoxanthini TaxID=2934161 RepID=UPI002117DB5F|nr:hypothetical protein [Ornithinimicrobium cryptoxanthini]
MSSARVRSTTRRLALAGTAGGAATILAATAAMGAPFATQASATALHLSVLDPTVVVDTTTETAENDGSTETVTASEQPLISLLNGQDVLTAGALGEVAVANNDGTSAACSGVTGEGGLVDVGDAANCTTPGTAPVVLNLVDVLGLVSARIEADAITATCETQADGTSSGQANLVGARLVVDQPLLIPDVIVDLDTTVAPNTDLLSLVSPTVSALLSPLVSVTLNQQVPLDHPEGTDPGYYGGLSVTAIDVDAVGDALANVELANVTCGPSADLALVPAVPLAGLPIALGTLAVVGTGVAVVTTKRRQATSH